MTTRGGGEPRTKAADDLWNADGWAYHHTDCALTAEDNCTCDLARLTQRIEAEAADARLRKYAGIIGVIDNAQGLPLHVATRATCAEHIEHGDDKATEPLTATQAAEQADARLREALGLLRELTEPKDDLIPYDYEQGLCHWCQQAVGSRPVAHAADCPYGRARVLLAGRDKP